MKRTKSGRKSRANLSLVERVARAAANLPQNAKPTSLAGDEIMDGYKGGLLLTAEKTAALEAEMNAGVADPELVEAAREATRRKRRADRKRLIETASKTTANSFEALAEILHARKRVTRKA